MNRVGVFFVLLGVAYLIYSIIYRETITIYFKNIKLKEDKKREYFKLQLCFSIINSLIIMAAGIFITIKDEQLIYVAVFPMLVHLVNYMMKLVGKTKGYLDV